MTEDETSTRISETEEITPVKKRKRSKQRETFETKASTRELLKAEGTGRFGKFLLSYSESAEGGKIHVENGGETRDIVGNIDGALEYLEHLVRMKSLRISFNKKTKELFASLDRTFESCTFRHFMDGSLVVEFYEGHEGNFLLSSGTTAIHVVSRQNSGGTGYRRFFSDVSVDKKKVTMLSRAEESEIISMFSMRKRFDCPVLSII